MRIRKNARLVNGAGAGAGGASSSSSFLVCQLNRSPWDVVDAATLQGDDFGFSNSSSCYFPHSIPASDSHPSGESMELSFEYVQKAPPKRERVEDDNVNANGRRFEVLKKEPPPIPVPPPPAPKRRGRPRKHTATPAPAATPVATSNPYEFYYYSGFGPEWGKNRRGGSEDNNAANTRVMESTQGSSSTSQMMSEDEDDHYNTTHKMNSKTWKKKKDNANGVDLLDSVADGELDYIEDDSDDDGGGRRVRKPIKARSLKSLM